jgi:hypothetical protein
MCPGGTPRHATFSNGWAIGGRFIEPSATGFFFGERSREAGHQYHPHHHRRQQLGRRRL